MSWQTIVAGADSVIPTDASDQFGDFIAGEPENQSKTCWLNQYAALRISGPDAEKFLQGQLTCDMSEIREGIAVPGACCTAKGRIVANFIIGQNDQAYWLVMPADSADTLNKHLQKYKVFFKADMELTKQYRVFGEFLSDDATDQPDNAQDNPGRIQLPLSEQRRFVLIHTDQLPAILPDSLTDTREWRLADIREGFFFVDTEHHDQLIPQQINWHQLGGVSFSKGCYTGQEIVARMQYLGKSKKFTCLYTSDSPDIPEISSGPVSLMNDDQKSGGDILSWRQRKDGNIELLALVSSQNTPEQLSLCSEDKQISVTLQNLPYTDEEEN